MAEPAACERALAGLSESYWVESRRPLAALVFTAPLLVLYEVGVLWLPQHARNGADAWMRQWLDMLGFGQYFLLPVLTVAILLAWHHVVHQPWRLSRGVLWGMAGECVFLSIALWLLLQLHGFFLQSVRGALRMSLADSLGSGTAYLGAGVYEELLFRLILLSLAIGVLRWLRAGPRWSMVGGVLAVSLLFAAAHHVGPYGEALIWPRLVFRFLAGVFFSVLFLHRGFGIAVGTHAGYDVLIGLTLAWRC